MVVFRYDLDSSFDGEEYDTPEVCIFSPLHQKDILLMGTTLIKQANFFFIKKIEKKKKNKSSNIYRPLSRMSLPFGTLES